MKIRSAVLTAIFLVFFTAVLLADGFIDINGLQVPLPQGAVKTQKQSRQEGVRLAAYSVNKPLDEVVNFYSSFLSDNGFLLIGGEGAGGFNASVKKGAAMFTLRISKEKSATLVEFIW